MLLSQTSQYALTGVIRLAALPPNGFCRLDDLVRGTQAARFAVAKVFHDLAKRGILESIRGSGGGFRLSAKARSLSLMDIIETVDGPWERDATGDRGLCLPGQPCPLKQILQPVGDQLQALLRKTRVEQLIVPVPSCCCAKDKVGDGVASHQEKQS
jgi:Rrf2 family iron-sulfur cluster assembly transcriptional regulator